MAGWRNKLDRGFSEENPKTKHLQVEYGISSAVFKSKVVFDKISNKWKEVITDKVEGDELDQLLIDFARSAYDLAQSFPSDKIEVIALSTRFAKTETNRLANQDMIFVLSVIVVCILYMWF